MKNTASLLMICNTVKSAYQIYRVMEEKKEYDCYYLSTALCPAHRQAKLKDIKEAIRESRTGNGANKILCITTPIIEAGVDISFETVVRSISGLDSIAQAGGRGNRNKERETGEMFLIKLSSDLEKTDKLPEIKLKQEITEEILLEIAHSGEDILSPEVMKRYFKKLHTKLRSQYKFPFENEKADISGTIFDILHENKNTRITKSKTIKDYHPYFQNRSDIRQADREFFVIKENGVGILVPNKGNAVDGVEIIAGLQSGGSLYEKYKLLQKAQQITITLFDYQRKELMEVGGLYEITDIPGLYVLNEQFYSENAGYQGIDNKGPQTFLHS